MAWLLIFGLFGVNRLIATAKPRTETAILVKKYFARHSEMVVKCKDGKTYQLNYPFGKQPSEYKEGQPVKVEFQRGFWGFDMICVVE